jgi:hypothetical protein
MMQSLSADVISHIGSFANKNEAIALTQVCQGTRARSDQLLRDKAQEPFGEIKAAQPLDQHIVVQLLRCCQKKPHPAEHHYTFAAPSSFLDRWKWLAGFENKLDKMMQENYQKAINFLQHTQATSVIQLRNQMTAVWHLNQEIQAYEKFKADEIARKTKGLNYRITLAAMKRLFKFQAIQKVNPTVTTSIETLSQKTFAKIGSFKLNDKEYDVAAFYAINDQYHYGETYLGIFEKHEAHDYSSVGFSGRNHNLKVSLARSQQFPYEFLWRTEEHLKHGLTPVSDKKRCLLIDLEYRSATHDPHGSDRLLDQKLTQIMVEMALQNKEIVEVSSNQADLPVLIAGGFKSPRSQEIKQELDSFRSKEENKLFPPYKNYSSDKTTFNPKNFAKKNVLYSRQEAESWADIIKKDPILNPDAAILPEYWAIKPNIVEDSILPQEGQERLEAVSTG